MRASDISCQMPLSPSLNFFVPSASIHHRACVKTYCPRIIEIVVNSTVTLLRVHIEGEWKYASRHSVCIQRFKRYSSLLPTFALVCVPAIHLYASFA